MRVLSAPDKTAVVRLLVEGFPRRNSSYWENAWDRLVELTKSHPAPVLGQAIVVEDEIVGVVLSIERPLHLNSLSNNYANLSSWYVKPAYRSYATMLLSRACKGKDKTYLNVSAATHTFQICEALGFKRYSSGQLAAVLLLSGTTEGTSVSEYKGYEQGLSAEENKLLADHQSYGCICLVGRNRTTSQPFVLVRRMIKDVLPCSQLVYCHSIEVFVPFARQIGLELAKRGIFVTIMDTQGKIAGIRGKYYEGRSPKYFKGNQAPSLCDLAYTEVALFGI
jgi:hypothetical protein